LRMESLDSSSTFAEGRENPEVGVFL
jgi:hypothetical protein